MTAPVSPRLALMGVICCLTAGCGLAHLQTAKTLPPGTTRTTVGDTFVQSGLRNARDSQQTGIVLPFTYIPLDIQVRHGLGERVEVGGRVLFGIGVVGDVKVNLVPPASAFALALSGGVGGAVGLGEQPTWALHVPVTLTGSYAIAPWFTPYAAVGYRGFWFFRADDPLKPDDDSSSPTGHGEGLVMAYVGVELRRASGRALLLEYGRLIPVVTDPGHRYEFMPTNLFSIAFRTGEGSGFER